MGGFSKSKNKKYSINSKQQLMKGFFRIQQNNVEAKMQLYNCYILLISHNCFKSVKHTTCKVLLLLLEIRRENLLNAISKSTVRN